MRPVTASAPLIVVGAAPAAASSMRG